MTAAERGAGAQETRLVALAGNPNVGKSTIFNALTGMHQHTGNWPGKTVALAQGTCRYKDTEIRLVDLPGTYALVSKSQEEALAAGFVSSGEADCVIAVCDATSLERSLILALQVMELGLLFMLAAFLVFTAVSALGGRLAHWFNSSPRGQMLMPSKKYPGM